MNKIIIVGHPKCGLEGIESLLIECGMSKALPSRREGLSPKEIVSTICRANGLSTLDWLQSSNQLKQLKVAPIWHGMALDLMLGNIDQPLWGWADSQVIYLLDYWKSLDPKIVFVLVYDTLETLSKQFSESVLSEDSLQRSVDSWVSYNSALLDFYQKNKGRSVLVHSQQVHKSVKSYVEQISARIDEPLHEPRQLLTHITELSQEISQSDQIVLNSAESTSSQLIDSFEKTPDGLTSYFTSCILSTYPHASQLYDQLQSAANLALIETSNVDNITLLNQAWIEFLYKQQSISVLERKVSEFQSDTDLLQQQVADLNAQKDILENLTKQHQDELNQNSEKMKQRIAELTDQKVALENLSKQHQEKLNQKVLELNGAQQKDKKIKEVQDENKMLLDQLFLVQEELVRHLANNDKPRQHISEKLLFGAADRVKGDLPYKLGATMLQHSHDIKGVLTLPLALYKEAKYFQSMDVSLPPIEKYQDKQEAEKIKSHLSYRLGDAVIQNTKNPLRWVVLPLALSKEAVLFQLQKKRKKTV